MPPLLYFEMVRRALERIVKDAGQPGIRAAQLRFGDAPLVPDTISVRSAEPTTCDCGRYLDKELIELQWLLNSAAQVLDFRRRKATPGAVTSVELELWKIGQQSRCTNRACRHFCACANDDGSGAKAA